MQEFEKNILSLYQEKGRMWLNALPSLIDHYASLWKLHQLQPYPSLSYNYVLEGYQQANPIVLKLSLDPINLNQEMHALKAFKNYGVVEVLDYQDGALLLQKAVSGHSLKEQLSGQQAIQVACQTIQLLQQAPLPNRTDFPHIKEWLSILDQKWGNIPLICLERARNLKQQLLRNSYSPLLLHGDLHQANILANGKEWLVIDPKGVMGFPICELWACVEDLDHDLIYLSNYFGFPYEEVVGWYYMQAVLAACWQVEDHLDPTRFLDLAQHAWSLLKSSTSFQD